MNGHPERRRAVRLPLASGTTAALPMSATVQVLDISESGALLRASQPLDVGRTARLRTRLGAVPVTMTVVVRRVSAENQGQAGVRLGAEFIELDDVVRRHLRRFLRVDK